ncbi:MAG: hypothetical protein HY758_04185 [Nitrospirae bacterium]|nr:hypothetical protein [Nitrospirota bacterium]
MITLDFTNSMSEAVGANGLNSHNINALKGRLKMIHDDMSQRCLPELYFLDLPDQDTREINTVADGIKKNSRYFLLLGIGGSALGPRALIEALKPFYNMSNSPKIFIYDNVDPATLKSILSIIDLKKTTVNVVTKSGSTVETMSSFLILMNALKKVHGRSYAKHIIVWKNPAYMCGALMYLLKEEKRKSISVLLPYSDRLKAFSEWYCQLWAESLGKNSKGQTPYPSVGTTDQHSQLQMWMDGPKDKVITFIDIKNYGDDISINDENIKPLSYLKDHTLGELIRAEREGTELALAKAGVPSMRLTIKEINGYYMGQLILFFELVTAATGMLYEINPFNQPGVEEGKNLTYGIMGRKGYEDKKKEVMEYRRKMKKSKYKIN